MSKLKTIVKNFKATARGYSGTKLVLEGEVFPMAVVVGAKAPSWAIEVGGKVEAPVPAPKDPAPAPPEGTEPAPSEPVAPPAEDPAKAKSSKKPKAK